MTRFGYTLMTEQTGPRELVDHAVRAERAGFDFEVSSDHYFPWLSAQGHAPYAWTVLGAVAHATERVDLMTYVTCPTIRYHPAVVAQKAATLQLLAEGRFVLGLGQRGEPQRARRGGGLAGDWPTGRRCCSRRSRSSGRCTAASSSTTAASSSRSTRPGSGTCPTTPVEIGVAVAGDRAVEELAPLADHLIAAEPEAELVEQLERHRRRPRIGDGARAVGQIPICWDPDKDAAVARAHEQFRWFAGGWSVNADLPTTAGFAAATQFVRPDDVADNIPCGPDLDELVEGVRPFWEAGFTDVALVQIGGDHQEQFLDEVAEPLLEKLRAAAAELAGRRQRRLGAAEGELEQVGHLEGALARPEERLPTPGSRTIEKALPCIARWKVSATSRPPTR